MADDEEREVGNKGKLILYATFKPQNIGAPQDIIFLNEAREYLEKMIDRLCEEYRYYRQAASIQGER